MSRQLRYRMTAIALGGLLLGVPLLTNGTASADQIEGDRQVTFDGGGMLGLSCASRPDVESMTVPAGSRVRVVNRTGHSAKLQLGGEPEGDLPDDTATEVVFRSGTTPVLLSPSCALGSDPAPSMISVSPSPIATLPAPSPATPGEDFPSPAAATSSSASARPMAMARGLALPDAMAPMRAPAHVVPGIGQAATRRAATQRAATQGAATLRAAPLPAGFAVTRPKVKVNTASSRTGGSPARAFAGMPPGEAKALVDGVPKSEVSEVISGVPAQAMPSGAATEGEAETVATIEPLRDQQPIGLLAVIAVVLALGVATAAIRSFVSQRANRADFA